MITVAGTVIADLFVRTIQELPEPGTLTHVDEIGFHLGGAAPNVGAVLARLDVPVSVLGRIGADPLGQLVSNQISIWSAASNLVIDGQRPTSTVVAQLFASGDRSFLYASGASAAFCEKDIDLAAEQNRGSRALHLGYAFLLPGLDGEPMRKVLEEASQRRFLVSIDVSFYSGPDWRKLLQLLRYVDIFCPNQKEAEAITGEKKPELAAQILMENGVRQFVAVKCGEDGVFARPVGSVGRFLAPFPVNTVDSTGAGDAFLAGVLAAWYKGFDWEMAASIGNAVGALSVTRQGATEGIDSWHQAVDFLKQRPFESKFD